MRRSDLASVYCPHLTGSWLFQVLPAVSRV
jgi:hypothetical protein